MVGKSFRSISSLLLKSTKNLVELGILRRAPSKASDVDLLGSNFGQTRVKSDGDRCSAATSISDSSE